MQIDCRPVGQFGFIIEETDSESGRPVCRRIDFEKLNAVLSEAVDICPLLPFDDLSCFTLLPPLTHAALVARQLCERKRAAEGK